MARMLRAISEMIAATTQGPDYLLTRDVLLDAAAESGYQFIEPDRLVAAVDKLEAEIKEN